MTRNQALTGFCNGMLTEATVRYKAALDAASANAIARAAVVAHGVPHYQNVADILNACKYVIQALTPVNSLRRVKRYL